MGRPLLTCTPFPARPPLPPTPTLPAFSLLAPHSLPHLPANPLLPSLLRTIPFLYSRPRSQLFLSFFLPSLTCCRARARASAACNSTQQGQRYENRVSAIYKQAGRSAVHY